MSCAMRSASAKCSSMPFMHRQYGLSFTARIRSVPYAFHAAEITYCGIEYFEKNVITLRSPVIL